LEVQVNSPIGHIGSGGDALVSKFESLVSSCSATGYSYISPTLYRQPIPTGSIKAAKINSTSPSTSIRTCPSGNTYLVQDGDTCSSIAGNHSVSTFNLIHATNNLDIGCKLLKPGKTICIPEQTCAIHKVYYGDTCWSLGKKYGTTEQQIIDWNENVNKRCTNIGMWRLAYLCVGYVDLKVWQILRETQN
jgi:LysM repeat protein